MPTPASSQPQLLIQPVERPILCSPYAEPGEHWMYDAETGEARRVPGRRPASYWFKTERVATQQLAMFAEEQREDLPLVNALRQDVKRWRESNYEGATQVTRELLRYWHRPDRPRRLFFCQLEAAETIIFLSEIRLGGKRLRFKPAFQDEHLARLRDVPADSSLSPLTRLGIKMATGSGKTVVMACLVAWAFCNRGKVPSDERFPQAILVVCPNLTIKERLQVLRPESAGNYYAEFDLVPTAMRSYLQAGEIMVTNWHLFAPESEHVEGGKSYVVVNKGQESPPAFARRVLGGLYERAQAGGGLLVLNDEGHHAWRPSQLAPSIQPSLLFPLQAGEMEGGEKLSKDEQAEIEEATVWVDGLDTLNQAVGLCFCVDLSATPFYIHGSGQVEGSPFPWLVSDFGLVDAIESGIVKIPRLPVSDDTGRPEPKYFRLWHNISENLQPGEKLPGKAGKPKPEVIYREAEPALHTLAGQWLERFNYIQEATEGRDTMPPVLIIVCDNTNIAEIFYRKISGEQVVELVEDDPDADEGEPEREAPPRGRSRKPKTKTVYGQGSILPEYLSNRADFKPTIRIDSKLLAQAESGDSGLSKQDAAEQLRRVVATVGKRGEPGEQVRCIVSVAMLNEGWDASNVTHILGLRAFGSQLLCEQVVGRGLRRIDYTPDPQTGLLTEEYVDIYGVPFSLIPYKGRSTQAPAPEDRPQHHVHALDERAAYEMQFPVVEGYAFALRRNLITADIDKMTPLRLETGQEPTAVFVKPRVIYEVGEALTPSGPGELVEQNRQAYYDSTHLQTIKFEIARQVVSILIDSTQADGARPRLGLQSRHQLFPQVFRLVDAYVERKVDLHGVDPRELGHEKYVQRIVERMVAAIRPDEAQGEPPLMPILNRYKPVGVTGGVNFKTVRPCFPTTCSHINLVVTDSGWERTAAIQLERAVKRNLVEFYARNDQLGLLIPYEYQAVSHHYEPDFLVRMKNGLTLILEIKGDEPEQARAKHEAAMRWVAAVNNWGQLGRWDFHVNRAPEALVYELEKIV
ncbi:MAG: DEAD/DEAH box helicase family protein [Thermoflexales bacterium]|nr:DEAD/DEAH box helicase family protein [Thermoflexales bacterium]